MARKLRPISPAPARSTSASAISATTNASRAPACRRGRFRTRRDSPPPAIRRGPAGRPARPGTDPVTTPVSAATPTRKPQDRLAQANFVLERGGLPGGSSPIMASTPQAAVSTPEAPADARQQEALGQAQPQNARPARAQRQDARPPPGGVLPARTSCRLATLAQVTKQQAAHRAKQQPERARGPAVHDGRRAGTTEILGA